MSQSIIRNPSQDSVLLVYEKGQRFRFTLENKVEVIGGQADRRQSVIDFFSNRMTTNAREVYREWVLSGESIGKNYRHVLLIDAAEQKHIPVVHMIFEEIHQRKEALPKEMIPELNQLVFSYVFDPNQQNALLHTYLHHATLALQEGDEVKALKIARVLLENGVSPNVQDLSGWTPLHIAAAQNFKAMVELLLQFGAKKSIRTILEQRPFDLAKRSDIKELLSHN